MKTARTSFRLAAGAALLVGTTLALAGCSADPSPSSGSGGSESAWLDALEPLELTVTEGATQDSANGQAWLAFQEKVTERTDGKVTFENYFAGSLLTGGPDGLEGIGSGVADMGELLPYYSPADLPIATWVADLGALEFDSAAETQLVASAASFFDYVQSEPLIGEFAANNLRVIGSNATVPYDLLCTKPVETVADAEGLRTRVGGPTWSVGVEELGMVPTTVAFGEVYEALQRGVIDCVASAAYAYSDYKWIEVADEYVPVKLPHAQSNIWAVNLDVWESFPAELQRIIQEEAVNLPYQVSLGNLDGMAEFAAAAEEQGANFNDASSLDEVVSERYATLVDEMVDTAPDGVTDPQGYIDDYIARVDEWRATVAEEGEIPEPTGVLQDDYAALEDITLDAYRDALYDAVQKDLP